MIPIIDLAGLIFTAAAIGLLVLGLASAVFEHTVLPGLFKLLIFAFMISGAVIAAAWMQDVTQVDAETSAHERELFRAHAKTGMLHWVEMILVFLPQALWVPQLREKPFAVIIIAGLSVLPLDWILHFMRLG